MPADKRYSFDKNSEIIIDRFGGGEHDPEALGPVIRALLAAGKTRPQLIKILIRSFRISEKKAKRLVAAALGDVAIEGTENIEDPFAVPTPARKPNDEPDHGM